MTPGSNLPLPAARVAVDVAAPVRLDVSGLLLTAQGKVRSDDDFIFYNQPTGPGVSHRPGGGAAPDAIIVDTAALPPGIEKVVVTASPDAAGQTFQGIEPTATVRDAESGAALATFTPPPRRLPSGPGRSIWTRAGSACGRTRRSRWSRAAVRCSPRSGWASAGSPPTGAGTSTSTPR